MYISIDVGGTNMRVALVDLEGVARTVKLESHPVNQHFAAGIDELIHHIEDLSKGQDIQGIGACFPGIIDKDDMVTTANNLPDWAMKPIKATLQERFGVPVKLVHDVQGAAIGEALFGAAKQSSRFVYFIWGTGIGAGDIKKIDENRYFMFSFENGHHIMEWEGKQCNCGQRGCPEAYLGGDILREYFGQDMATVADDDPRWDFIVKKAAQVVLNTLIFHPVDLFLFSGGVITRRPFLLERIQPIMKKRLEMFPLPRMVLAELGDQAALFGCAGAFLIDLIR
ncbi:MAG: ROK family protein [Chloroflexi bacterium]|nr:ROK family protein [Chloroflexota bacterium]